MGSFLARPVSTPEGLNYNRRSLTKFRSSLCPEEVNRHCRLLDVESRGSASLLNLDRFEDPFSYKLDIATGTAGHAGCQRRAR